MTKEKDQKRDILLQEKSDEMDIVEFCVGEQHYGVSIKQMREIIRSSAGIVPVADAHPSVSGVVNLRGKIIPVINLAAHFGIGIDESDKACRIIISENQRVRVGFLVNRVTRIHRILLSDVEYPSDLVQSKGGYIFGITRLNDRILFLLDLEKLSCDIRSGQEGDSGAIVPSEAPPPSADFDRTAKKILVAEDSPFMRNFVVQYIKKAGYAVVTVKNGFEAWQILEGTTQLPDFTDIADYYHLLVTDIEMPQMDGLHLIKNIREHSLLNKLPCIVFSSLITNEISKKCIAVGADGQISKPEINRLISTVDDLVFK